jgi:hypothetical protein
MYQHHFNYLFPDELLEPLTPVFPDEPLELMYFDEPPEPPKSQHF